MIVELFVLALVVLTSYLWLLNRRLDALPHNANHSHVWLKDPISTKISISKSK